MTKTAAHPLASTDAKQARGQRKVRIGVVVSNKMSKTIVVRVGRQIRHPKYGRVLRRSSTFKAHDEQNSAVIGDLVKIMETRPISKEKCWRLVEVIRRASTAPPVPGTEQDASRKPQAAGQSPESVAGSLQLGA